MKLKQILWGIPFCIFFFTIMKEYPLEPLLEGIPFSKIVLDSEGRLLRLSLSSDEKYRIRVTQDEIPTEAEAALLLYEDRYFYKHPGVNPFAILRAAFTLLTGGKRMGASTLTMQTARLRYGLKTKTLYGKLYQMWIALCMEVQFSKSEIINAYFHLAPYGKNIEGIAAAARIYFHKPVSRLTQSEILALTVVPQNPAARAPIGGADFNTARQRIHALWYQDGRKIPPLRVYSPSQLPFEAPHIVTEFLEAISSPERINTTIQLPLQHLVEGQIKRYTDRGQRFGLFNASAILVHAPSLEVRALCGSADFFNSNIEGQVDGTRARRSPGSTLKPFIYALALDQGIIHPHTLLLDSRKSFAGYDPENFDRTFRGPIHAAEALRTSRNIPAISLAAKLKSPGLYSFLKEGGVSFAKSAEHYGLSLVLGGAEVSMRELAQLYAMLINQGYSAPIRFTKNDDTIAPKRLLSPEAAWITLNMLEYPEMYVRGKGGNIPLRLKTGTSNGFRDAWAAGILGEYVLIVWVGDFTNKSGVRYVGSEAAVPLWENIGRALSNSIIIEDIVPKQRERVRIAEIPVCRSTGDLDISLCEGDHVMTYFIPGVSPVRSTGILRKILIDKATGLRACVPATDGSTEEKVWEFWQGEYRRLFALAGVEKPLPPPFLSDCKEQTIYSGKAPFIMQPKDGIIYYKRLSQADSQSVPLQASLDADADTVFWFSSEAFLGSAHGTEPLFVKLDAGIHYLRAVDNLGRSTQKRIEVRAVK